MNIPEGWTKLGPGAYADADGALHVLVEEILETLGAPNTPETRRAVQNLLCDAAASAGLPAPEKSRSVEQWLRNQPEGRAE